MQANAGLRATGQSQTETRRRCEEMGCEGIREVRPAIIHVHDSWACSASVSCRARWCQGRGEVEKRKPYRKSSLGRTIAREVAEVEALLKKTLDDRFVCARARVIAMAMAMA